MKRFTKILVLLLMLVTVFTLAALPAFASEAPLNEGAVSGDNTGDNTAGNEGGNEGGDNVPAPESNKGIGINVDFSRFVNSLQYMWKGMLCIFIVIGVIIAVTWALNKTVNRIVDARSAKENSEE